jgi:hypothetical protein
VERADEWASLSPAELLFALQSVKYVGTWTAGVAVADLTNDFSLSPLAEFGKPGYWERFAAPIDGTVTVSDLSRVRTELSRDQLSTVNLLYLDWSNRHQTKQQKGADAVVNTLSTSGPPAADAAYETWQNEVGIECEPLDAQDPGVRERWAKVAAAACAAQAEHENANPARRDAVPWQPQFQAPPPNGAPTSNDS